MTLNRNLKSKHELAFLLYIQGETAKSIALRIEVSERTLGKWISAGGWKERRAAATITRTELINKTLKRIHDLLEKGEDGDVNADKLTKLASMVEKLDKKSSPIIVMDVFMNFGRWVRSRAAFDKSIDIGLLKQITTLQDLYITEIMGQ